MQRVVFCDNSLYFNTMKNVSLYTLGCKLNFAETSAIGQQFLGHGFNIVEANQPCDVFVLNTCSVTGRADRECRQIVRRVLRHSPHAYIIVTGCYAQLQPREIGSLEGVDLILGTREKSMMLEYLAEFRKQGVPQIFVSCIDEPQEFEPAFSGEVRGRTRAFLKVQDGCDYNCSYCTIPLARGESRSQPIQLVLQQAALLAVEGYKEIVLTGVNVGDYGRKLGTGFFELLRALDEVNGLERIRISSIEPDLLSREMVDFVLQSKRICNHFHIPLQSGSDAMLKRMRRRYLAKDYQGLVEYVKTRDSDAGIGVDVIVGFPGETDELFKETYVFLANLPVSYLHVFTYSERPNTHAAQLPDAVEPKVRAQRSEALRILSQKKRYQFYSSFIGRTVPVLFEGTVNHGCLSGLTTNYIRVEAPADRFRVNEVTEVVLTNVDDRHCVGEPASHYRDQAHGQLLAPSAPAQVVQLKMTFQESI